MYIWYSGSRFTYICPLWDMDFHRNNSKSAARFYRFIWAPNQVKFHSIVIEGMEMDPLSYSALDS